MLNKILAELEKAHFEIKKIDFVGGGISPTDSSMYLPIPGDVKQYYIHVRFEENGTFIQSYALLNNFPTQRHMSDIWFVKQILNRINVNGYEVFSSDDSLCNFLIYLKIRS